MRNFLPTLRRGTNDWMATPHWSMFDKLFDEFGLANREENKEWLPSVDVSETEDHVVVRAEVPGMDKKDIDITLSNGLLTIRGEKKMEKKEEKENYRFVESRYGSFSRSLRVPEGVEAEKIEANYKDGVLKVTIPKGESEKSRKIEIAG